MKKNTFKIISNSRKSEYLPWYVFLLSSIIVFGVFYYFLNPIVNKVKRDFLELMFFGAVALVAFSGFLNSLYQLSIRSISIPQYLLEKGEKVLFFLVDTKFRSMGNWRITKAIITNKKLVIAGVVGPFASFLFRRMYLLDETEFVVDDDGNLKAKNASLTIYTDHGEEILKEIKRSK